TTLEVLPVHQADGLLCGLVVLELDEGESTGTSGLSVRGNLGVHHLAGGAERLDQLIASDVEAQVSDEDLVRNGRLSSVNFPTARCRRQAATEHEPRGAAAGVRRTVTESRRQCSAGLERHVSTRPQGGDGAARE